MRKISNNAFIHLSKKLPVLITASMLMGSASQVTAFADEVPAGICYISAAESEAAYQAEEDATGVADTATSVTEEMCHYEYWLDKNAGSGIAPDSLLISREEAEALNDDMLHANDAYMNDLENLPSSYNADALGTSLAGIAVPTRKIYINSELLSDNNAYYGMISDAIAATCSREETAENSYGIAIHRTPLLSIPTKDYIGYSINDGDDENVTSALNVNEPFIIRQRVTVSGNDFYWGYCTNCTGWVCVEDMAVCADRDEWLDAWKVDPDASNFIVVTCNNITLEPSHYFPELSEVKLTFGTVLKSVPEDEIPDETIGGRGTWNNHVVYLPTMDETGAYVKSMALISQHYELNEGYPEMTQNNILRLAFNNLGDRYGWGGMLDSMDCSLFNRNIYKCFGLEIPRNTTWQKTIPGRKIDLSEMNDEEKLSALEKMPAGTMLYFPNHTMIYTGMDGGMGYVISDTGSLSDSIGDLQIKTMYSVIINPLSVKRKNGLTWLRNLDTAMLPFSKDIYDTVTEHIEKGYTPTPDPGIKRVPLSNGQTYASASDTLALDTFLGTSKNLFIDFDKVEGSGVDELSVTALKGSTITTKAPVNEISCDKKTARTKKDKRSGLGVIKLKKSGTVSFNMADGKSYSVRFTVDSPKPRKKEVKELLKTASGNSVSLNALTLFGTGIDAGELKIVKDGNNSSRIENNTLVFNTTGKNRVKILYRYLDRKYSMTLKN